MQVTEIISVVNTRWYVPAQSVVAVVEKAPGEAWVHLTNGVSLHCLCDSADQLARTIFEGAKA